MREILKAVARGAATIVVAPALASYYLRSLVLGRDRALEGSTQALAWVPGILGQYIRRAFLVRVLAGCHVTAVVEFGTIFAQAGARLDENAYVGPRCHLGLVHIERDVLLAAGVHIPSGARSHGTDDVRIPIRDQHGSPTLVRIGSGSWIGAAAVVMADVGRDAIVGAGAVVTRNVPDRVVAAGVPARIVKHRDPAVVLVRGGKLH
jgi:acetyltransferase-like isoleucine patch superfamily enzyme